MLHHKGHKGPTMKQTDVDRLLAWAQVLMSFFFAFMIFALLFVLIFKHDSVSGVALTIITSVIASLITVLTLQQNFFFARTRPPAIPDPTSPPSAPTLAMTLNSGDPNASPPTASATATSTPASPAPTGAQPRALG